VVTTSLYVVTELMETDATIHLIGGEINKRDGATISYTPHDMWDFFSAPKAILGVGGVSAKYGITDYTANESRTLKELADRAMSVIIVADNSKFGLVHPYITCPLPHVSRIITGIRQKEDILQDFADYRQRFIFADGYDAASLGQAEKDFRCNPAYNRLIRCCRYFTSAATLLFCHTPRNITIYCAFFL